jgi:hypothetical protein
MRRMLPVLVMMTVARSAPKSDRIESRALTKWAATAAGTMSFLIPRITACSSHDRIV